jgi:hypothetical protein
MGNLGGPSASGPAAEAGPAGTAVCAAADAPPVRRWAGLLGLSSVAHHVRLRKRLPLGPRGLSGELGLDTDLKTGATLRQAAVTYEVRGRRARYKKRRKTERESLAVTPAPPLLLTPIPTPAPLSLPSPLPPPQLAKGDRALAALRLSPGGLHACRVFTLALPFTGGRVALRARGLAGVSWGGRPEFSFDVDDVRPAPLVVAAAGAALASGQCLSVARPLATACVRVPSLYDAWTVRADGRFAAQRTGKGAAVGVDVKEVSFFLDL